MLTEDLDQRLVEEGSSSEVSAEKMPSMTKSEIIELCDGVLTEVTTWIQGKKVPDLKRHAIISRVKETKEGMCKQLKADVFSYEDIQNIPAEFLECFSTILTDLFFKEEDSRKSKLIGPASDYGEAKNIFKLIIGRLAESFIRRFPGWWLEWDAVSFRFREIEKRSFDFANRGRLGLKRKTTSVSNQLMPARVNLSLVMANLDSWKTGSHGLIIMLRTLHTERAESAALDIAEEVKNLEKFVEEAFSAIKGPKKEDRPAPVSAAAVQETRSGLAETLIAEPTAVSEKEPTMSAAAARELFCSAVQRAAAMVAQRKLASEQDVLDRWMPQVSQAFDRAPPVIDRQYWISELAPLTYLPLKHQLGEVVRNANLPGNFRRECKLTVTFDGAGGLCSLQEAALLFEELETVVRQLRVALRLPVISRDKLIELLSLVNPYQGTNSHMGAKIRNPGMQMENETSGMRSDIRPFGKKMLKAENLGKSMISLTSRYAGLIPATLDQERALLLLFSIRNIVQQFLSLPAAKFIVGTRKVISDDLVLLSKVSDAFQRSGFVEAAPAESAPEETQTVDVLQDAETAPTPALNREEIIQNFEQIFAELLEGKTVSKGLEAFRSAVLAGLTTALEDLPEFFETYDQVRLLLPKILSVSHTAYMMGRENGALGTREQTFLRDFFARTSACLDGIVGRTPGPWVDISQAMLDSQTHNSTSTFSPEEQRQLLEAMVREHPSDVLEYNNSATTTQEVLAVADELLPKLVNRETIQWYADLLAGYSGNTDQYIQKISAPIARECSDRNKKNAQFFLDRFSKEFGGAPLYYGDLMSGSGRQDPSAASDTPVSLETAETAGEGIDRKELENQLNSIFDEVIAEIPPDQVTEGRDSIEHNRQNYIQMLQASVPMELRVDLDFAVPERYHALLLKSREKRQSLSGKYSWFLAIFAPKFNRLIAQTRDRLRPAMESQPGRVTRKAIVDFLFTAEDSLKAQDAPADSSSDPLLEELTEASKFGMVTGSVGRVIVQCTDPLSLADLEPLWAIVRLKEQTLADEDNPVLREWIIKWNEVMRSCIATFEPEITQGKVTKEWLLNRFAQAKDRTFVKSSLTVQASAGFMGSKNITVELQNQIELLLLACPDVIDHDSYRLIAPRLASLLLMDRERSAVLDVDEQTRGILQGGNSLRLAQPELDVSLIFQQEIKPIVADLQRILGVQTVSKTQVDVASITKSLRDSTDMPAMVSFMKSSISPAQATTLRSIIQQAARMLGQCFHSLPDNLDYEQAKQSSDLVERISRAVLCSINNLNSAVGQEYRVKIEQVNREMDELIDRLFPGEREKSERAREEQHRRMQPQFHEIQGTPTRDDLERALIQAAHAMHEEIPWMRILTKNVSASCPADIADLSDLSPIMHWMEGHRAATFVSADTAKDDSWIDRSDADQQYGSYRQAIHHIGEHLPGFDAKSIGFGPRALQTIAPHESVAIPGEEMMRQILEKTLSPQLVRQVINEATATVPAKQRVPLRALLQDHVGSLRDALPAFFRHWLPDGVYSHDQVGLIRAFLNGVLFRSNACFAEILGDAPRDKIEILIKGIIVEGWYPIARNATARLDGELPAQGEAPQPTVTQHATGPADEELDVWNSDTTLSHAVPANIDTDLLDISPELTNEQLLGGINKIVNEAKKEDLRSTFGVVDKDTQRQFMDRLLAFRGISRDAVQKLTPSGRIDTPEGYGHLVGAFGTAVAKIDVTDEAGIGQKLVEFIKPRLCRCFEHIEGKLIKKEATGKDAGGGEKEMGPLPDEPPTRHREGVSELLGAWDVDPAEAVDRLAAAAAGHIAQIASVALSSHAGEMSREVFERSVQDVQKAIGEGERRARQTLAAAGPHSLTTADLSAAFSGAIASILESDLPPAIAMSIRQTAEEQAGILAGKSTDEDLVEFVMDGGLQGTTNFQKDVEIIRSAKHAEHSRTWNREVDAAHADVGGDLERISGLLQFFTEQARSASEEADRQYALEQLQRLQKFLGTVTGIYKTEQVPPSQE